MRLAGLGEKGTLEGVDGSLNIDSGGIQTHNLRIYSVASL